MIANCYVKIYETLFYNLFKSLKLTNYLTNSEIMISAFSFPDQLLKFTCCKQMLTAHEIIFHFAILSTRSQLLFVIKINCTIQILNYLPYTCLFYIRIIPAFYFLQKACVLCLPALDFHGFVDDVFELISGEPICENRALF